jgi:hypothetical protein
MLLITNFSNFCLFPAKKGVFFQINVTIKFLHNLYASTFESKMPTFSQSLSAKKINIIPGVLSICTTNQYHTVNISRVTSLGEFSPIRQLLTLGTFLKMAELAQIFGLPYSKLKIMYLF